MPPKSTPTVRVLCTLENASTCINGKAFATVAINDVAVHLSERLSETEAERFTKIPGYALWGGDEAANARRIEDALERAVRATERAGGPRSAGTDLQRQLDEQRRSNFRQADEIRSLQTQVDQLTTANATLNREAAQFKTTGIAPGSEAFKALQENVDRLTSANATLTRERSTLADEVAQLKKDNASLAGEVDQLKKDNAALTADLAKAKAEGGKPSKGANAQQPAASAGAQA